MLPVPYRDRHRRGGVRLLESAWRVDVGSAGTANAPDRARRRCSRSSKVDTRARVAKSACTARAFRRPAASCHRSPCSARAVGSRRAPSCAASSSCSRRCSRGSRGAYLRRCRRAGHAGNITPPLYSVSAQLLRWRCIQANAGGSHDVTATSVDPTRRLRLLRTRFAELEGMGVADLTDRLSAFRGARALRPVPGRRGRRQRRHLHRSDADGSTARSPTSSPSPWPTDALPSRCPTR